MRFSGCWPRPSCKSMAAGSGYRETDCRCVQGDRRASVMRYRRQSWPVSAWARNCSAAKCVVSHEQVSAARRAAIAHYGAEVIEVPRNITMTRCAMRRSRPRGTAGPFSDTTWEGYREIPVDVMHGYA